MFYSLCVSKRGRSQELESFQYSIMISKHAMKVYNQFLYTQKKQELESFQYPILISKHTMKVYNQFLLC